MVAIIITMVVFYTPQVQVIQFSVILVIFKALLVLPQFLLVHLISLPVIVLLCTDFILICLVFIAVCSHGTLYFSFYYILKIFIVGVYIYHMFIFSDKCKLQEGRHLEGYVLLCIITCVEHNALQHSGDSTNIYSFKLHFSVTVSTLPFVHPWSYLILGSLCSYSSLKAIKAFSILFVCYNCFPLFCNPWLLL